MSDYWTQTRPQMIADLVARWYELRVMARGLLVFALGVIAFLIPLLRFASDEASLPIVAVAMLVWVVWFRQVRQTVHGSQRVQDDMHELES